MKPTFSFRRSYAAAFLCGLHVLAPSLSLAAETLVYDPRQQAHSDTDAANSDYQARRNKLREQAAQIPAVPEPAPLPTQMHTPSLPPPSMLLHRQPPSLKTAAAPQLLRQAPMPPQKPAAPADYDRLAYTPPPPPLTPAGLEVDPLAALPAPLADPGIAAAVAPPPPPFPWQIAAAPAKNIISSPGIIVQKEHIHLAPPVGTEAAETPQLPLLAQLSPAAGDDSINAMVPLIQTPEQAAAIAAPAKEPAQPAAPPLIPSSNGQAALDEMLKSLPEPAPATEIPVALPSIAGVPGEKKAEPAGELPELPPVQASSEPAPQLSSESTKILEKIPSNLEKKKKIPAGLAIDHGKDTKYVSKNAEPQEEKKPAPADEENAMGMKIKVQRSPVNLNYELEKAYNALLNGQTEAATGIYKMVLDNDPKNTQALFGLATTYHRAGQIDMARPLYAKLLALEPDNRDALNNFLVLLADEAPQEALEQLERLEERNPDFSPIPAQMAVIYQRLGDTERASQKMFKAIALAPENITYRYNLAIMLDKQKKTEEAIRLYKQIVEAHMRGEVIPGNIQKIQERLTFLSSNRS